MKYIVSQDGEPGIFYSRYLEYLETIRNSLPAHIYQFASSEKYFNFDSPHSLHDAHLRSLEIRESRRLNGPSKPFITLKLSGPNRDREIVLKYEKVESYKIACTKKLSKYGHPVHRDVFTHEIRLSNAGMLIHEIFYWPDTTFIVECRNITHREQLVHS